MQHVVGCEVPSGAGAEAGPAPGEVLLGAPRAHCARRAPSQEANCLLLFFLSMAESVASQGGAVALEHPEDRGVEPFPSIWATEVVLAWESRVKASRLLIDQ